MIFFWFYLRDEKHEDWIGYWVMYSDDFCRISLLLDYLDSFLEVFKIEYTVIHST